MQSQIFKIFLSLALYLFYIVHSTPVIITNLAGVSNATALSPQISPLRAPNAHCVEFSQVRFSSNSFFDNCLGAWLEILQGESAHSTLRWIRSPPGRRLRPGFAALPFEQAYRNCMLKLDLWSRDNPSDELALADLGGPFRTVYEKCILPKRGEPAAGYIAVGKRRQLKFAIGPAIPAILSNATVADS